MRRAAALLNCAAAAAAMYDRVLPAFVPPAKCAHGCARWADLNADGNPKDQSACDAKWAAGKAPAGAGNACAMPANDPGTYTGWCYCAQDDAWDYCTSPATIPTQVNVQTVGAAAVVVSFVTFDGCATPEVQYSTDASFSGAKTATGICHGFTQPGSAGKHYAMHFVKLSPLAERTTYHYRARASPAGNWTADPHSFTSLYSHTNERETRFAIFGDMGLYTYNNMDGLKKDMEDGEIDFLVHLGDHAYNMEDSDGLRGDGYLNAFQDVISNMPWMPVLGNHEFIGGAGQAERYLNETYGIVVGEGDDAAAHCAAAHNTQTPLNSMLTLGAVRGAAAGSGTSRYYSQDIGVVHLIAFDMNVYYNGWEAQFRKAQLAWLEKDLQAASDPAQRAKVPWIAINVHHPFYCTSVTVAGRAQVQLGEAPDGFEGCVGTGAATTERVRKELEPLMLKYGVDLFFAGHEHNYETTYPVADGKKVQGDYTNPRAPVHIVTGAGGAPALDRFGPFGPYTRNQKSAWGYGQVVANRSAFKYTHILNADHSVFDEFVITQEQHGAFPSLPPTPAPPPPPPPAPCAKEDATVCHGWTCECQGQACKPGTPGASAGGGNCCCSGQWQVGACPCQ